MIVFMITTDHHERKLAPQLGPQTGGAEGLGIEDDVESCPGACPQTQSLAIAAALCSAAVAQDVTRTQKIPHVHARFGQPAHAQSALMENTLQQNSFSDLRLLGSAPHLLPAASRSPPFAGHGTGKLQECTSMHGHSPPNVTRGAWEKRTLCPDDGQLTPRRRKGRSPRP